MSSKKVKYIVSATLVILEMVLIIVRFFMLKNNFSTDDSIIIYLRLGIEIVQILAVFSIVDLCVIYAIKKYEIAQDQKTYILSSLFMFIYSTASVGRAVFTSVNHPEEDDLTLVVPLGVIAVASVFLIYIDKSKVNKRRFIIYVCLFAALLMVALYGEYDLWNKSC